MVRVTCKLFKLISNKRMKLKDKEKELEQKGKKMAEKMVERKRKR